MSEAMSSSNPQVNKDVCSLNDYEQAIDYLFNRLNYERTPPKDKPARAFKLERMQLLLSCIDNPQAKVPVVHIAGTKGKGSTAVMIAEMLQAGGHSVGLFTSPHIRRYEERIRVNGEMPTADEIVSLIKTMRQAAQKMEQLPQPMIPTFFEMTTAMAWLFFVEQKVDIAVMEVGLGGRLDSTNICNPVLTIITNISHDHTAILGKTLSKIAFEKGGIIKTGVPVICGIQHTEPLKVIQKICKEREAPLIQRSNDFSYQLQTDSSEKTTRKNFRLIDVTTPRKCWRNVPVPLAGQHQAENASLAMAAINQLDKLGWNMTDEAVGQGMQRVQCPVRIEYMQSDPTIIIDAAHNCASIEQLIATLSHEECQQRHLIFATTRDKDVRGMLEQLLPVFDSVILTQYLGNPRALPVDELATLATSIGKQQYHLASTPTKAWQLAMEMVTKPDLLCITGSFFIAAEMRELVLQSSL